VKTNEAAWVTLAVTLAVAGCGTTKAGAWDATGYKQATYGWMAPYPKGAEALLGPPWQLDNWTRNDMGQLEPKDGPKYVARLDDDENGNGVIDAGEAHKVPIYDLKFVSGRDNGVLWVQTRPLSPRDVDKDLDVLVGHYADSLAGTGLYEQGTVAGLATIRARTFTTFVTDKTETKLGPHPALAAVIELAEVDRLRADPSWRSAKIRLAVAKFDYQEALPDEVVTVDIGGGNTSTTAEKRWKKRTAVVLVGYYNDAEHFDAGLGSFDALVARIRWPHQARTAGAKPTAAGPPEPPSSTPAEPSSATPPPAAEPVTPPSP
jgi:hypothetical protein